MKITDAVPQISFVLRPMGSEFDRLLLALGIELLKKIIIPYDITIHSAHLTPMEMVQFAEKAASEGTKVIIAVTGGPAHIHGMVTANT